MGQEATRPFPADKIESKVFSASRHGYDPSEVRAFLRAVAAEFRRITADSAEAIRRAGELVATAQAEVERVRAVERDVELLLASAEQDLLRLKEAALADAAARQVREVGGAAGAKPAEEVVALAAAEADAIRAAAEQDAQRLLAAATEAAEQIRDRARREAEALGSDTDE